MMIKMMRPDQSNTYRLGFILLDSMKLTECMILSIRFDLQTQTNLVNMEDLECKQ